MYVSCKSSRCEVFVCLVVTVGDQCITFIVAVRFCGRFLIGFFASIVCPFGDDVCCRFIVGIEQWLIIAIFQIVQITFARSTGVCRAVMIVHIVRLFLHIIRIIVLINSNTTWTI